MLASENIVELLDKTLNLANTDYDLKRNYDFKKIRIVREYEDNLPAILGSADRKSVV